MQKKEREPTAIYYSKRKKSPQQSEMVLTELKEEIQREKTPPLIFDENLDYTK